MRLFEDLGCSVDKVDAIFEKDPCDLWTAEFYAGVGTRLRSFVEKQRELLDPAVAEVLEAALNQEMRDYYEKVFERYALREKMRKFFETYDLLLSPVLPVASLDAGKNIPDHLTDRTIVSWVYYTYPVNLIGHPAGTWISGDDIPFVPDFERLRIKHDRRHRSLVHTVLRRCSGEHRPHSASRI